jgi:hypothetical protein
MLLLAALNVWDYPRRYTGAFVLGNLFTAILMRNELFGRILYAVVNYLFAKVFPFSSSSSSHALTTIRTVAPIMVPPWLHVGPSTLGRHTFWLRNVRLCMAHLQGDPHFH